MECHSPKKESCSATKNNKNEPTGCYAKRSKNLKEKDCIVISLGFQNIK